MVTVLTVLVDQVCAYLHKSHGLMACLLATLHTRLGAFVERGLLVGVMHGSPRC